MINLKRNRSSIQSQPPISTQPVGKLSRLKSGFSMFNRLTITSKHAQAVDTSIPVPFPPSPREDRFQMFHLFRDHSSDNFDTFLHSDKLKMMHSEKHNGKTKPRSVIGLSYHEEDKYMLKNAQTVSNDATDKRLLTTHKLTLQKPTLRKPTFPRRNSVSSMTSTFSFTPKRKTSDNTRPLPSPVSSQRGHRRQLSQISSSSDDESVGSGSLTAKEFAKEAGIDLRYHSEDDEAQFTTEDSVLSHESIIISTAARGMTVRSCGGKSLNSIKARLNIWEDNFWKKPGTEDEPLSPPLSPSSLGPEEFSSSSGSECISQSPSTDILLGFDISQATHRSFPLPKPMSQLKHDIPLSSSYPSNNTLNLSTHSFQRFLNGNTIPGGTIPGAIPITIPPPPKNSLIAEPPFLAHLRRATMISNADALTGAENNLLPPQAATASSKPAVIRKGRFEIVLGGQDKDAEPSLNPREVPHQQHHQLLHEPIPRKSVESERERVREWRRKSARARTSSDAGSSFDDRSELSVKLDGSAKD